MNAVGAMDGKERRAHAESPEVLRFSPIVSSGDYRQAAKPQGTLRGVGATSK